MNSTTQQTQPAQRKYKLAIRLILTTIGLVFLLISARETTQIGSSHTLTNDNLLLLSTSTPSATMAATATTTAKPTNTSIPSATATRTALATKTSTPTATRTVVPTSTPETTVTFFGEYTNLRTGPGTSYAIVRKLVYGEFLRLLGRTSDNSWIYVKTEDNQEGWIRPTWVKFGAIDLNSFTIEDPPLDTIIKVLADPANLRTGPGDYYEKVMVLSHGDMLTVLGRVKDNSWIFVRTPGGQEGWIAASSVNTIAVDFENNFHPIKTPPPTPTATLVVLPDIEGHWIDVDLGEQTLYAYDGQTLVASFLVSTGIYLYPTRIGQYHIYVKYDSALMHGPDYYLPDVPWIMYYDGDYSIHGTYWHHNFGTPMSHGCINMDISDAGWLYEFAPVGTLVNIHY